MHFVAAWRQRNSQATQLMRRQESTPLEYQKAHCPTFRKLPPDRWLISSKAAALEVSAQLRDPLKKSTIQLLLHTRPALKMRGVTDDTGSEPYLDVILQT